MRRPNEADPSNADAVKIEFADSNRKTAPHFRGPVKVVTFGAKKYVWHPEGLKSHADPDGLPATSAVNAKDDGPYTNPSGSITVLTGRY